MTKSNQYLGEIRSSLQVLFEKMQPEMMESLNEHEMTPTQLFVLSYLKKVGSSKVSQIAELMDVKPSAVTLLVDRLEQHNFVAREHNKEDRRVVDITLTEFGHRKLEDVLNGRKAIMDRYLLHLTEEELSMMASITKKLATSAASYKDKQQ
ncbi:MarR family winged helix-turn-helix transcriptional regulator [Priestia megaterium]|uniref:MarR family winged helix-turn-helix transcriptional regulator n=1 Tax=Priestia megaterium TaxID=1404 RepID=UPI0005DE0342|nr:MarR family transcriptional regulator [Priestia megaterium]MED3879426.1 MarR family transcriptional regulator [Priestia megaterium]MED3980597.1 MarR family transcriptional regulator [Priestia megaterium]CJG06607.1 MarR family transcriptional regulator [Streptococcus pneumoniae]